MNIYVGNLPWSYSNEDLERLFEGHGVVTSANVIMDRATNRSRGFGFIEMENDEDARKAIQELEGTDIGGRKLTVNEARPRQPRSGGGGGGYGGGGGGGGYGGGGGGRDRY